MTEPIDNGDAAADIADDTTHAVPLSLTPDDVAHLLDLWRLRTWNARVEHVETEGPRRTWTLWENGTQTGHVRGRNTAAESWEREARKLEASGAGEILVRQDMHLAERCMDPTDEKWSSPWTWEVAGSGRAALGMPALEPTPEGDEPVDHIESSLPTGTINSTRSKRGIAHVETGIAPAGPPTANAPVATDLSTSPPTAEPPTTEGDEP
jgi:hypothetical protein